MRSKKYKASAGSDILPARSRTDKSSKIQTISRAQEDVGHGQEIENREMSGEEEKLRNEVTPPLISGLSGH